MSKGRLESLFGELLEALQPRREFVTLFNAIVLDVWKDRQAEAGKLASALRRRIDELRKRKDRLVEAYLYQRTIDQETYQEQLDKLKEETALAELELYDVRIEELDVEGVLSFAEHVLINASRIWVEATIDHRLRLQQILFPEGVEFDGESFGTPVTSFAFKWLQPTIVPNSSLASRTGVEPVSPP